MVAAGIGCVLGRADSWIGSWKQALDMAAGSTLLIGPVLAGAAALAYARLRSSAVSEILLQGPRDWLRWLQPLLTTWALGCLALVLVALGTTTAANLAGAPAYPQYIWILLPAFAVLGAQTAIGTAFGYAAGRPWTAPLAAVFVFLLFLWTVNGPLPTFFVTGGVTGTLAGETFVAGPVFGPGVAAVGIAGVVLAAAHPRLLLATMPRKLVAAGAVAILALGWVLTPGDNDARYAIVADPAVTCAGSAPEVCVLREVPRPLDDLAEKAHAQASALVEIGAPLPQRFSPSPHGSGRRKDGVVLMWTKEESARVIGDDSVTRTLVTPAECAADTGDDVEAVPFDARHLLGRWIQMRAGLLKPGKDDGDRAWLTRPSEAQQDWVRTTYRQLAECDFAAIRMPDGLG